MSAEKKVYGYKNNKKELTFNSVSEAHRQGYIKKSVLNSIKTGKPYKGYFFVYERATPQDTPQAEQKIFKTELPLKKSENNKIIRYSQCKRIVSRGILAGDFHCGSFVGLTPPQYQINGDNKDTERYYRFQKESWNWFSNKIEQYKPFDFGIWNGDLIDGHQDKAGGIELMYPDMRIQTNIATDIIEYVNPRHNFITKGTPYHVGKSEDWETIIADNIGAKIGGEIDLNIAGVVINAKHKVGSSSLIHGRATPALRNRISEEIWQEMDGRPRINLYIRNHVHYYLYIIDARGHVLILPALQGAISKFGRECEKPIDYGFAIMDIYEDKTFDINVFLTVVEAQKRVVINVE